MTTKEINLKRIIELLFTFIFPVTIPISKTITVTAKSRSVKSGVLLFFLGIVTVFLLGIDLGVMWLSLHSPTFIYYKFLIVVVGLFILQEAQIKEVPVSMEIEEALKDMKGITDYIKTNTKIKILKIRGSDVGIEVVLEAEIPFLLSKEYSPIYIAEENLDDNKLIRLTDKLARQELITDVLFKGCFTLLHKLFSENPIKYRKIKDFLKEVTS